MKNLYFFLFITYSLTVFSQEKLSAILYNDQLINKNERLNLTPRSGDSMNIQISLNPLQWPFFDDFSTDKRFSFNNIKQYRYNDYFDYGACVEVNNFKKYKYYFSNNQTYQYFCNKVTNKKDSIPTTSATIFERNNTSNCGAFTTVLSLYPVFYNYTYDNQCKAIDSTLKYDTAIEAAFVRNYSVKGQILWTGDSVYINNHYPYNPLSLGVATFDGLNDKGKPYNQYVYDSYGSCDILTSIGIDLSLIKREDSLYLSFWVQPQGLGQWPNVKDSLILEFKDDSSRWNPILSIPGVGNEIDSADLTFKPYVVKVPWQIIASDPNYYFDKFQFRFRNFATQTGNNDHWHIDFVYLDTARNSTDTTIRDANFMYDLGSILKNYTLMPAKQFIGASDLADTLYALNRNILSSPILSTYNFNCKNVNQGTSIFQTPAGIPYTANPLVKMNLSPKTNFNIPVPLADSTTIYSSCYLDISDDIIYNDTANISQLFFNELAYDDGSAEKAYGLIGVGVKKFAYKFVLNKPDTLAAIKIEFSNIDIDVSNLIFNVNVWKSIGYNGQSEVLLKTISNLKPVYTDTLNNFATFGLDTPILVSDSFYVGWTQVDDRDLQIGYDRNSVKGFNNMYIFVNNVWSRSNITLQGSPMIRVILDGTRDFRPVAGIHSPETAHHSNFVIYPNPSTDYFQVKSLIRGKIEVELYDLIGKSLLTKSLESDEKIDISQIPTGTYLINLSKDGERIGTSKLVILR